ncbi:MAG: metallophosphoesterase family protein [Gemmatimonadota bacterium]
MAALYDIHGNAPALAAVLDEVRALEVDGVVVGGDVFPGPMGPRCLELLTGLAAPVYWLRGNGDRDTLEAFRGGPIARVPNAFKETIQWCANDAGSAVEAIDLWPPTVSLDVAEFGEVLFCHAAPGDDNTLFLEHTPETRIANLFEGVHASLVVCGHTHMQFDRTVEALRVVNAGSVGMPFGPPGAYWAILSSTGIELRRTTYDYEAAARTFAATEYPLPMNPALPPTAESMISAFESSIGDHE